MASPRKLKAAARAGRSADQKGRFWDYFQYSFPGRAVRDEARDRDGVVVYRTMHLGRLQAPDHNEQYEVCWKRGDTYDTVKPELFSWQQLQPMLTDRFAATHFAPPMMTHMVLPLQERNWHATNEEYGQMIAACTGGDQHWQEVTKEKSRQLAQMSGERAAAAEGQLQAAKKPRKPAAAAKKAAAAPAAATASKAVKAKGKPAAAAAAAGGSKAAAAKPAKAAPTAAAAAGKSTAKAGSSAAAAAAAGAKKRPAAALALSAKRQKTSAAAAAAAAQDDDEAAAAAAESSEEEPGSESEEQQQQSDDDSDSEPSSDGFEERRAKPLRVQQPRGQQQQQQRKGRQAAEAAAAAAAPPSASKNTKKEQQQQKKKQAAVKQEPAGKRSKPDAAAAEMTYKGHTGRSYPSSVACARKDKRIGTHAYAQGEASGEYPVAWIVDEVSYMLPGSTKKQHKVLPKWEGYELDVNGWEDAAGMAELDCYKDWQSKDKPAYYTAVKPAAAANAFIAWKQTGKRA